MNRGLLVISVVGIALGVLTLVAQPAFPMGPTGGWLSGRMSGMMGNMGPMGSHMSYMGWNETDTRGTSARDTTTGFTDDGSYQVNLQDMRFRPEEIRIPKGTKVRFVNNDPFPHNVVNLAPDQVGQVTPSFMSPTLGAGEDWEFTFDKAGTYDILCTVSGHYLAGMVGKIIVTE